MKYYLIVGEASGDLHAAQLMKEIKIKDENAEFRFFGGEEMDKVKDSTMVKNYKELAYMGFIPVLMHLPTILSNMKMCKKDIVKWKPDVLILVDYPGFNLKIAKYISKNTNIPVFYYIAPKIWAWKEYRIKAIKRDVNKIFSILPFEKEFFEDKHKFPINYVGNPTMDEVREFQKNYKETKEEFKKRNKLTDKPIIALIAGSRKQEIKDNLKIMINAATEYEEYQIVVAGAPGIDKDYYKQILGDKHNMNIVFGETFKIMSNAELALVTSGTATLETALFNVPQVVCYFTPMGKLVNGVRKIILKVPYISLVNLIAGQEVVKELVADQMNVDTLKIELGNIIKDQKYREQIIKGYKYVEKRLGNVGAPKIAAEEIISEIKYIAGKK